ncbi:MAG: class I SAM-dependent methyltransferase [Bacteroidales bacterium]|nr:class I SAM-dependent methyltransferase [Bacteroidales bacterium]
MREKERKVVFDLLNPMPNENILDAGCGSGSDAIILMKNNCNVYGIDISKSMIDVAVERGIKAEVADLEHFDLKQKFDKITSNGVLEFCSNHTDIFDNFNKHLNTGGIAVLHFPIKSLTGYLYWLYHRILHSIKIRLFTYKQIKGFAENSGFSIQEYTKAHSFIAVMKLKKVNNIL